jgi:tyrosine-protein phosphatase YwqE
LSFFQNIFSKGKSAEPVDLSALVTDLHSHLIPGIDDGVKSYEESIQVIKALCAFGYKKIITTPHIMSDYYKNTPEIIKNGLYMLREEISKQGIDVEIDAAAEYYIDDLFIEKLKRKELLTFSGNHILVELPFFSEPKNFFSVIFELVVEGYKPVLAHVERYTYWYHDFENYEKLKDREILLQMNLTSLYEDDNSHLKKMAEKLIEKNMIDIVGGDVHNMHHIEKIKKVLHNSALKKLVESDRLLNNKLFVA